MGGQCFIKEWRYIVAPLELGTFSDNQIWGLYWYVEATKDGRCNIPALRPSRSPTVDTGLSSRLVFQPEHARFPSRIALKLVPQFENIC